jgi:hypothetical protein
MSNWLNRLIKSKLFQKLTKSQIFTKLRIFIFFLLNRFFNEFFTQVFMSTQELQQIETRLLKLSLEDLQLFISDLLKKSAFQKKKMAISKILTRDATPEEGRSIQAGLDSGFLSPDETKEFLKEIGYK